MPPPPRRKSKKPSIKGFSLVPLLTLRLRVSLPVEQGDRAVGNPMNYGPEGSSGILGTSE